jgi:hypothetical protein
MEVDWGQSDVVRDERRALIYIVPSPRDFTLGWRPKCTGNKDDNRGRGQMFVYSQAPRAQGEKSYAWPVSGKVKVDDNYFGENHDAVNQQIRHARCKDGHKESCD